MTPRKQAPVNVPTPRAKTGTKRKAAPSKVTYADTSEEEEESESEEAESEEEDEPPPKRGKQAPGM